MPFSKKQIGIFICVIAGGFLILRFKVAKDTQWATAKSARNPTPAEMVQLRQQYEEIRARGERIRKQRAHDEELMRKKALSVPSSGTGSHQSAPSAFERRQWEELAKELVKSHNSPQRGAEDAKD
ncbi:MAG: hypothetical protein AB7G93_20860 [Bdellovibrionales bacterium]